MTKNKHIVSKDGLTQLKVNLCRLNKSFTIRSTAGSLVLECDELNIRTRKYYKISGKIFGLFKTVEKSANIYIIKNDFDIKKIKRDYPAKYTNKQMYLDLPEGFEFFYVDIKHCYWRIVYLIGVLNKKTYIKYRDSAKYKLARNISLSILTSEKSKEYYENGELILKVTCDNTHYKTIYRNIRYTAYNFSGRVKGLLEGRCIGYYVDGFMILPEDFELVRKEMRSAKMYYSVTKCKKIDAKKYWYGDIEKRI